MIRSKWHRSPMDSVTGGFPGPLEETLRHGNAVIDRLQRRWPTTVPIRSTRPLTVTYASYPFYFVEAFPGLDHRDVQSLAVAFRLVADSIFVTDTVCDREAPENLSTDVLTIQALQYEAYRLLFRLFSPTAVFWSCLRDDLSQWMAACTLEASAVRTTNAWPEVDDATLDRIAMGKAAVAKSVVSALVEMSGDSTLSRPLRRSVEHCHFGVQLLDDLIDWRTDLSRGTPTHVVKSLRSRRGDLSGLELKDEVLTEYGRELYYNGAAFEIIERALVQLDQGHEAIEHLAITRWEDRIARCRQRCESLARDLTAIVDRNHARRSHTVRIRVPRTTTDIESGILQAVLFLAREQASGFAEARHHLAYPCEFDPLGEEGSQECAVYQRALVLQTLVRVRDFAPAALDPLIEKEYDYLVGAQLDSPGTWSYFPTVTELPLSTDVVAQVVIGLHATGLHDRVVADLNQSALQTVLAHCGRENGSFSNWLVSPAMQGRREIVEEMPADDSWLWAADVEVAASMAASMDLYGPTKFRTQLEASSQWIARQQQSDGTWCSNSLYVNKSYSTFVCARALQRVGSDPGADFRHQLERTRDGVIHRLRSDVVGEPKSQTTAFDMALVLMTLDLWASEGLDEQRTVPLSTLSTCIKNVVQYLMHQQLEDGSWPQTPFLRIGGRGFGSPTYEYGSRTITTAFAVSALASCLACGIVEW